MAEFGLHFVVSLLLIAAQAVTPGPGVLDHNYVSS